MRVDTSPAKHADDGEKGGGEVEINPGPDFLDFRPYCYSGLAPPFEMLRFFPGKKWPRGELLVLYARGAHGGLLYGEARAS